MQQSTRPTTPTKNNPRETLLMAAACGLTFLSVALAFVAWGDNLGWQLSQLSTYLVFPLFGLLAFSVMWSQYIVGATKRYLGLAPAVIKRYFDISGLVILTAILLHPGLLIAQRYHDGYGLPPGSYESYVAPMQKWIVILGSLSLLMFLAYELKRWYGQTTWWKYIVALNDVAILAIFYHGLQLGQDLGHTWYRGVWYFYGLTLVPVLLYKYWHAWQSRERVE